MSEPAQKQERIHLLSGLERFIKDGPTEPGERDEDGYPSEDPVDPKPQWAIAYVSVYGLEQSYGGPEEGGWWFDEGDLEKSWPVRVRLTGDGTYDLTDDEQKFVERVEEEILEEFVFGTSYRTSCGPRRGDDYTWRLSWRHIEHFPEVGPHYC